MTASTPVTPELPKVLMDVTRERQRQIEMGWTPEHDDTHNPVDMEWLARARLNASANARAIRKPDEERRRIIQAMAILAALVESIDRKAKK
jgi:hypothetical protein